VHHAYWDTAAAVARDLLDGKAEVGSLHLCYYPSLHNPLMLFCAHEDSSVNWGIPASMTRLMEPALAHVTSRCLTACAHRSPQPHAVKRGNA
jgi:hypothetical protein